MDTAGPWDVTAQMKKRSEERRAQMSQDIDGARTKNEDTNTVFEPFFGIGCLGYKVILASGAVRYITLNPDTGCDEGPPDVFVYIGETGDPANDDVQCYFNIEE